MPAPGSTFLQDLRNGLPKGPMWITGEYIDSILSALQKDRARAGENIDEIPTPNGRFFKAKAGGTRAATIHPFKVITRRNANGTYSAAVYRGGLFKSLKPNDLATITGLTLITDTEPTWFALSPTDLIWLTMIFNYTLVDPLTSVTLNSYGRGDSFTSTVAAWSGNNGYCEDNGDTNDPIHQTSRIPIAFFFPDGTGAPQLSASNGAKAGLQSVITDLILYDRVIDGRYCRYPEMK